MQEDTQRTVGGDAPSNNTAKCALCEEGNAHHGQEPSQDHTLEPHRMHTPESWMVVDSRPDTFARQLIALTKDADAGDREEARQLLHPQGRARGTLVRNGLKRARAMAARGSSTLGLP